MMLKKSISMRYVLLINTDRMEPVHLLRADPSVHLSVLTKSQYAPLYEEFAEVWLVDDVRNLSQVQEAALSILRRHPIDAIVAPYERSLLAGGFLRSYFGLPGPGFDHILPFTNK